MKEYFSHDYNARNDNKLVKVFMKYGLKGIGAYWCIIEMLYEEGGYLLKQEYERISFELRTDNELIEDIIENYDLFIINEDMFWSETAIDRIKERMNKSEKARESINYRWSKYERNTNVERTKNDSNTIKGKERKGKESKEEIAQIFYSEQIKKIEDKEPLKSKYITLVEYLFGKNEIEKPVEHILKLKSQLSFKQYKKLYKKAHAKNLAVADLLDSWLNNPKYSKGKISMYLTLNNWINRDEGKKLPEPKRKKVDTNPRSGQPESLIDVVKNHKK